MTLLAIYSKTPGLDRFIKSTSGLERVLVELEVYPGHPLRWNYLPEGLTGQIIFCDTDDVIYQGDLPELTGIVTAPENVLHKETVWKKHCIGKYEVLLDKPVYNVGTFSMDAKDLYEYRDFTRHQSRENEWDQLNFNLWLLGKEHTPRINVFLPLYNNLMYAEKEDGIWHVGGEKAVFVHANGNNKELL